MRGRAASGGESLTEDIRKGDRVDCGLVGQVSNKSSCKFVYSSFTTAIIGNAQIWFFKADATLKLELTQSRYAC